MQLQTSVQQMLQLLQIQQREIESLRLELQQQQQTSEVVGNLQSQIDGLEGAMVSKVIGVLSQHSQSESILD